MKKIKGPKRCLKIMKIMKIVKPIKRSKRIYARKVARGEEFRGGWATTATRYSRAAPGEAPSRFGRFGAPRAAAARCSRRSAFASALVGSAPRPLCAASIARTSSQLVPKF